MFVGIGVGLYQSSSVAALSGAASLLAGETDGLAFDFTDQTALIRDTGTPANNYSSAGTVTSGTLVGPGGKLTYTSASNKLVLQATGYYSYSAHNLKKASEELTNGAFWAANRSSISASGDAFAIIEDSTAGTTHRAFGVSGEITGAGGPICITCRMAPNGRSWVYLAGNNTAGSRIGAYFNLSTGTIGTTETGITASIESVDGTYYDCTVRLSTSSTTDVLPYIGLANADNSPSYNGDGVSGILAKRMHVYRHPAVTYYVKTTTAATYSLPIEYDTDGTVKGLLVEEQRTNLITSSNAASYLTALQGSLADGSTYTSPFGTGTSVRFTPDTANSRHLAYKVAPITGLSTSTVYTHSTIARSDYTGYFHMQIANAAGGGERYGVVFDLNTSAPAVTDTNTTGTPTGTAATVKYLGNGWYMCTVSMSSMTSTGQYPHWGPAPSSTVTWDTGSPTWTSTALQVADCAHMQLEAGSFPTSPILTYGAAATRLADPLSQLTSTFPLSATAGSFYAYVTPYAGADLAGIVSLNDGSGDEEIVIYKDASANIVAQVEDGGVGQLAPLDSTVNASSGTAFKVALAWAANDFALSASGTAAQTDTGGTLPTVTTLEIGVDQANNYFNGHIKAISYVPRRKSNAELQAETA